MLPSSIFNLTHDAVYIGCFYKASHRLQVTWKWTNNYFSWKYIYLQFTFRVENDD